MKTQKTTTSISLRAALFSVILSFGSANAEEILTAQEHVQIAKRYEVLLKEEEAKLAAHLADLKDYKSESYKYGRGGQAFESHEIANIHQHEDRIAEIKAKIALHRKLAGEVIESPQ